MAIQSVLRVGHKSMLKIYFQNVRGLRTKTDEFITELIANSYDVIVLSETWLNNDFYDHEFFDNCYVVFRVDRNYEATGLTRGGGCLIAVKSELSSIRMREWELSREDVWISVVHDNGSKTNLNVRYIEGDSNLDSYLIHFNKIIEIVTNSDSNDSFVLLGDYNLADSVKWYVESSVYKAEVNVQSVFDKRIPYELFNLQSLCDLKQLNLIQNDLDRTLDLLLTDIDQNKVNIKRCLEPLVYEDDHHPALTIDIDVSPLKYLRENRPAKTNFYKADYDSLNQKLLGVEWEIELDGLDTDSSVYRFYEIVESFIDEIPKVQSAVRDYPVYFTYNLIKLIKKKSRAKSKLKRRDNEVNRRKFATLRRQVKREIKVSFSNYVNDCELKIKSNTKSFFAFTKSLKKTNSISMNMKYGDQVSSDPLSICDLFANFFTSVYLGEGIVEDDVTDTDVDDADDSMVIQDQQADISFTVDEIQKVLKGFDENKVSSPDAISMMFYKKLADSLALPLCILFNKSLRERCFPEAWKKSFISPIFKDGDKHDVTNYRAVSIICSISKIFERLIFNRLFEQFKHAIHPSQHGFFSKRSTQSNLMEFVNADEKLSFKEHINATTRKAYQMLGFIFRCGKFFKKPESMITLYNTLVRSRLEYCSTVWSPFYVKYNMIIERVQRKFTRMYYYKFGLNKQDYTDRLKQMKMHSLESRRLENDEITLYKIIHNMIDTTLIHSLSYQDQVRPSRRQHPEVFYLPRVSSNIEANEPMYRIQRNHDIFFPELNLNIESINMFKNYVKNKLNY